MPEDLYPREVNPVLLLDAAHLHHAAVNTYRLANRLPPADEKPEATAQRKAILTIAARLQVLERDQLLDRFCADWLRFRKIPIPESHEPTSGLDSERPAGTNGSVQAALRSNEVGTQPTDNEVPTYASHIGGQPVP